MIKVRTGDIRIGEEEKAAVLEILENGQLTEGGKVREFERSWAGYIGTKYCTAVNSGTSALLLGLHALLYDERFRKVKKGSKIITSPVTYTATANAIMLSGFEPVFVDIDPYTFTLNIDQIENLLRQGDPDDYSIILPVHLIGYPNDMDGINELAEKYDLVVFEDSAQAHGSLYKGKRVGSLSLLSDYSFYIAHNVQVGEMGAIVTSDDKLSKLFKKIKANGRVCACPVCTRREGKCPFKEADFDPRFTHDHIGFNFKTTEFQAAIGLPQIGRMDAIRKARYDNVKYLNERLDKFSDILQLPVYSEDISYLSYPVIIKAPELNRNRSMERLEHLGIETRPIFGCIPTQQPAYSFLKAQYENRLPNADWVGANGFYVGCHQYLGKADLDCIAEAFNEIF